MCKEALENLYHIFSKYTTVGMTHCDCGCISETAVKRLFSKPLRELDEDDLLAYHDSALFTWGEVEHYKHFLPRLLDLFSRNRDFSNIDLWEIHNKLEYAKWKTWEVDEINAIKQYILEDWIDYANHSVCLISDMQLGDYANFISLENLLKHWDIHPENAFQNFINYIYHFGSDIFAKKFMINKIESSQVIIQWIDEQNIETLLEKNFYKFENKDTAFAEKISVVLQIIER